MGEGPWELCEVRAERRRGFGIGYSYRLEAVMLSAAGASVIDRDKIGPALRLFPQADDDPRFRAMRAAMTARLLAQGWETTSSVVDGRGATLPRFRRRVTDNRLGRG